MYTLTNTLLELQNVDLGYSKDNPILKSISFTEKNVIRNGIDATGQIVAILGRSGRGKSTLFKGLTGLLKPLKGSILIKDLNVLDSDIAKQIEIGDMGLVSQKYTLFRHKSVYSMCEYALRNSISSKEEKKTLIDAYLSEWGLLEHKDKYSCDLSGGQRQRLAILENILSNKHFMIFDEPAASLDVISIEKLKEAIKRYQAAHEMNTIIFSTHDLHLAVELADSIYVIGHPEGVTTYSTIVKSYDLKTLGLAWQPYGEQHLELVKDITSVMRNS